MVPILASAQVLMWSLWAGLALLTLGLVVLMRTRWGRSRPLHKCALLSLLAHVLFFGYAATVQIVASQRVPPSSDEPLQMTSVVVDELAERPRAVAPPRWEQFAEAPPLPPAVVPPSLVAADATLVAPLEVRSLGPVIDAAQETLPAAEPDHAAVALADDPGATPAADARPASALESPAPQRQAPPDELAGLPPAAPPEAPAAEAAPLRDEWPSTLGDLAPSGLRRSDAVLVDAADAPLPAADDTAPPAAAPAESVDRAVTADAAHEPPAIPQRWSEPSVAGLMRQVVAGPEQDLPPPHAALPPPSVVRRTMDPALSAIPAPLRMRVAPDRLQRVQQQGGSEATERAVERALAWLAANQEADGRWSVRRHGGGVEQHVLGHDRQGAGARADTAVTGLALLAFLGAGHTHQSGQYRDTIAAGLHYLLRTQDAATGHLAGNSEMYAHMYAHGMATLALGEACSLSGDERLREPLRRAIHYTLAAQHPAQGGWRYRPGDVQGDTSQLGWQLMALCSAELAGLEIPLRSRQGMERFLASVAAGPRRGLASYRPGERPSRTMTAEALFCRQLLGLAGDRAATDEAEQFLLGELPGQGPTNYYYWYYATLALYHAQGEAWQRWNAALQTTLLQSQETAGDLEGSWPATSVWGGYGGRVYSTALACLCLEVYYRYLPLYAHLAADPRSNQR